MVKTVCLAILNYNGTGHLEYLLPTVRRAVAAYPAPCRAVVLDNCSTQGDADWVRSRHPDIEVIAAPANDYLFSYNWLLPRLSEDVVVLLNNDLRVSPGFLGPLLRHFEREDVFAVSATSLDWEGKVKTCGPAVLKSHHGWYYWSWDTQRQEPSHTLFSSGGFSALSRAKFLDLGGFSRAFYPAYCEDLDLCFRAWRRGWRSVFEPRSVVFHRENGSWGKGAEGIANPLSFRSQLLFAWLTLPPAARMPTRYLMYAWLLLLNFRHGRRWCVRIWLDAVRTWLQFRRQYGFMKVTRDELRTIQDRICERVPVDVASAPCEF